MEKDKDAIVNEITTYCMNECPIREACAEDECVLFRIEKIVVGKEYYEKT